LAGRRKTKLYSAWLCSFPKITPLLDDRLDQLEQVAGALYANWF